MAEVFPYRDLTFFGWARYSFFGNRLKDPEDLERVPLHGLESIDT